jgi:glycosyltransferase involved in cell wall biosynthesis
MVVIPNGYDTRRAVPQLSLRAELGVPTDARVVGRIARWHPWKDHPRFLEAVGPLMHQDPALHVLLVGEGLDSGNAALARHLLPLPRERVHLLGRRDDMDAVYGTLDLLCSSSSAGEGFPNVVAEAMLSGVPVVTTDVGESARIVGNTGAVVPPADATQLREALARLLAVPANVRTELGAAARRSVQERYSVERMVMAYDDLHRRVADRLPLPT